MDFAWFRRPVSSDVTIMGSRDLNYWSELTRSEDRRFYFVRTSID